MNKPLSVLYTKLCDSSTSSNRHRQADIQLDVRVTALCTSSVRHAEHVCMPARVIAALYNRYACEAVFGKQGWHSCRCHSSRVRGCTHKHVKMCGASSQSSPCASFYDHCKDCSAKHRSNITFSCVSCESGTSNRVLPSRRSC
jgi:hypothetical protein